METNQVKKPTEKATKVAKATKSVTKPSEVNRLSPPSDESKIRSEERPKTKSGVVLKTKSEAIKAKNSKSKKTETKKEVKLSQLDEISSLTMKLDNFLENIDPNTAVDNFSYFDNEDLEVKFDEFLSKHVTSDTLGDQYYLGNIDKAVKEFFNDEEVAENILEFVIDDSEDEDDDDDSEDEEEEEEDSEAEEEEEDNEADEAEEEEGDEEEEEEELEGDEEDSEDDSEEEFEEFRNQILFTVPLKSTLENRVINITYTPIIDDEYKVTGVERNITIKFIAKKSY